jgi:hypothetical protein
VKKRVRPNPLQKKIKMLQSVVRLLGAFLVSFGKFEEVPVLGKR